MSNIEIIVYVVFAVLSAVCFYFMWKELGITYNKLKDKYKEQSKEKGE